MIEQEAAVSYARARPSVQSWQRNHCAVAGLVPGGRTKLRPHRLHGGNSPATTGRAYEVSAGLALKGVTGVATGTADP